MIFVLGFILLGIGSLLSLIFHRDSRDVAWSEVPHITLVLSGMTLMAGSFLYYIGGIIWHNLP